MVSTQVATGGCARKFPKAQAAAVTALAWARDGAQLVSAASDGAVRTHGLKSGRQLQHFRGHAAAVAAVAFGAGDAVLSAAADATVRVWDARSAETTATFEAANALAKHERRADAAKAGAAVVALLAVPGEAHRYVVVDRSPTALLADPRSGAVHATYSTTAEPAKAATAAGRTPGCAFAAGALSRPTGAWFLGLGEDRVLYCFETKTGKLDRCLAVGDGTHDVTGVACHPHRALAATFGEGDQLALWRA